MEGSPVFGRCGRLVPAMTRCECVEMSFDDVVRRLRDGGRSLDAVQMETGAGLLCTACQPDLRERLAAEGMPMAPESTSYCGLDEPDDADDVGADSPPLAATHDPR